MNVILIGIRLISIKNKQFEHYIKSQVNNSLQDILSNINLCPRRAVYIKHKQLYDYKLLLPVLAELAGFSGR